MIYRLNDEFTKIEETEGLLQNRSENVEIEFVVCKENPQKDSGIILAPAEKYTFSVKEGDNIYARSNKMTGALANLAVLNFKKPASGGSEASCICSEMIDDMVTAKNKTWSSEKIESFFKEAREKTLWKGSVGSAVREVRVNTIKLK